MKTDRECVEHVLHIYSEVYTTNIMQYFGTPHSLLALAIQTAKLDAYKAARDRSIKTDDEATGSVFEQCCKYQAAKHVALAVTGQDTKAHCVEAVGLYSQLSVEGESLHGFAVFKSHSRFQIKQQAMEDEREWQDD